MKGAELFSSRTEFHMESKASRAFRIECSDDWLRSVILVQLSKDGTLGFKQEAFFVLKMRLHGGCRQACELGYIVECRTLVSPLSRRVFFAFSGYYRGFERC